MKDIMYKAISLLLKSFDEGFEMLKANNPYFHAYKDEHGEYSLKEFPELSPTEVMDLWDIEDVLCANRAAGHNVCSGWASSMLKEYHARKNAIANLAGILNIKA